jgi:hypothetical protein
MIMPLQNARVLSDPRRQTAGRLFFCFSFAGWPRCFSSCFGHDVVNSPIECSTTIHDAESKEF